MAESKVGESLTHKWRRSGYPPILAVESVTHVLFDSLDQRARQIDGKISDATQHLEKKNEGGGGRNNKDNVSVVWCVCALPTTRFRKHQSWEQRPYLFDQQMCQMGNGLCHSPLGKEKWSGRGKTTEAKMVWCEVMCALPTTRFRNHQSSEQRNKTTFVLTLLSSSHELVSSLVSSCRSMWKRRKRPNCFLEFKCLQMFCRKKEEREFHTNPAPTQCCENNSRGWLKMEALSWGSISKVSIGHDCLRGTEATGLSTRCQLVDSSRSWCVDFRNPRFGLTHSLIPHKEKVVKNSSLLLPFVL